jgi:hypothetical protein
MVEECECYESEEEDTTESGADLDSRFGAGAETAADIGVW